MISNSTYQFYGHHYKQTTMGFLLIEHICRYEYLHQPYCKGCVYILYIIIGKTEHTPTIINLSRGIKSSSSYIPEKQRISSQHTTMHNPCKANRHLYQLDHKQLVQNKAHKHCQTTVDGRNPAPLAIYQTPSRAGFLPLTVWA